MANRKIAYTLGRGRAYIFDMSSTSGYMGEKYFQEFGPRFFDMSSASGYMGEKYFQEFGPRFLDMSYCQKGSHLHKGGWISVVRRVFTGGVIIMKSRVLIKIPMSCNPNSGLVTGQQGVQSSSAFC